MFKLKADSSAGRWVVRENKSVAGRKDIIINFIMFNFNIA